MDIGGFPFWNKRLVTWKVPAPISDRLLDFSHGYNSDMRTLTLLLIGVLIGGMAFATEGHFQKARILRVHVGYVIPPPPDSAEGEENEKHEAEEKKEYEHSAFIFVKVAEKQMVMQVDCGEHCTALKQKLDALRNVDVEVRVEKPKMWLKTTDQAFTGKLFSAGPKGNR